MATTINITNSGSGAYLIDNVSNGTIQLIRGNTYNLVINAFGHPFWIQTVSGEQNVNYIYNSGITNNGTQNGTIVFVVPNDAPSTLYYVCQFHSEMQGIITITGSGTSSQVPTITGFIIQDRPYLDGGTFTLITPTSNSTGEISYESSDPTIASISGSTVTILQAGIVTITANQAETTNYTAGSVTATFTISKLTPSISNFTIEDRMYVDGETFTLTTPTSDSPGAFSYESSAPAIASISGSTVTILQEGDNITITATQSETTNYTAGSISTIFNITSNTNNPIPTITDFIIQDRSYSNGGTFTLTTPTSNSPSAFSYQSSAPSIASISGSTVTILQTGNVTITAFQASNANFRSGRITATFTINKADTIITGFSIQDRPYSNRGTFTLTTPTSNSTGTFSYESSAPSIASISGSTVTILQAGNVTITASQASTTNYTAGSATSTFTISKLTPSISNFIVEDRPYLSGSTYILTPPLSDSTGIFSYESSNPTIANIVDGTNTVNILQLGNVTITAYQAPTINYESSNITASFDIVNPSIVCLTNPSKVNIIASNGNKYVFNNLTLYESTRLYGLGIGTYILQNVQESHPMALLNKEVTSSISYSGDSNKKLTKSVNGVSYDFYYGNITVQVNSNFNTISIYCYYHGYMGGENLFIYSDSCYIKSNPNITNFDIPNDTYLSVGIIRLTPPLSNSSGAFSYYSSNPKIAIIDGSKLIILQVGTITITAIQAETSIYNTGSISKTLTINRIPSNFYNNSIIYLNDCTACYTSRSPPERITTITPTSLNAAVRLVWEPPQNISNVIIDSYVIWYKFTGAPLSQTLGEVFSFVTNAVVSELSNGVSYDFWIVAKNRFGESPYSPIVTIIPGAAPSPSQIMRRAYHSTTAGNGMGLDPNTLQKIGIEFTPPASNNGAPPIVFTIKYRRISDIDGYVSGGSNSDISFVITETIQDSQVLRDASNDLAIRSVPVKGEYNRREIIPPYNSIVTGNYRFEVFTNNSYGISNGPDVSFVIPIYSFNDANMVGSLIPRIVAPTFSYYTKPENAGIVSIVASDSSFRFRWKQYRGTGNGSTGSDAYAGWVYRIQYTDDKDYWYSPPSPILQRYPEYTVPYDRTSQGSNKDNFEYFIDISNNVINGRRYYLRYCVVNALGDTSEYTQVTDTNLSLVSTVPGKPPLPPPIFNAAVDDRLVRLFFTWYKDPPTNKLIGGMPSSEMTGGPPLIDYRIDRYIITRTGNVISTTSEPNATFYNIVGPYYEDTKDIRFNGAEYLYRIFTRTAFGYSTLSTSVTAIPSRKSDVVYNVTSAVDTSKITLNWYPPRIIEPGVPIVQYYIQYRIFDRTLISQIPSNNIVGSFTNSPSITVTIQDMNSILVNDALWSTLTSEVVSVYTNSTNLYYTIGNLTNKTAYVFRIGAVTQDKARRNLIGLIKVIAQNSPYLSRPTIIGKVPERLQNVRYTVGSGSIIISWSGTNVTNSELISRFIVDYRIFGSGSEYLTQTFEYINSVTFNNEIDIVLFSVTVTGLETNVSSRPLTNINSYEMVVYAENAVGYTNTINKINLHADLQFTDVYENLTIPRLVRPASLPSIIREVRE
jgi:uncharacterized protein YjdB